MEAVNLLGVFPIGPENFLCALLEWEGRGRVLPVWLPPLEGAQLAARLEDWSPRRPFAQDALADLIGSATAGVAGISITSYHNGVFISELLLDDATRVDLRTSDALILAAILDVPLEADESVLQKASLYVSPGDALDYFGVELESAAQDDGQTGGEAEPDQAALDFAEFMRELGVDEDEFGELGDED